MDPSGSESLSPDFPRKMFAMSEEPVSLRVTSYHKLPSDFLFWRRLCLRMVEWTVDSRSKSSGSISFVSIVERCSVDGGSIYGDDDSFPAWLLLDWCVGGGTREYSDL
ncbi:hypothetical protein HA466_0285570 [Hirschfeldia incana]|nr:hypothetical protein HA466_0285570 [Hirschfeldia incana]